MSIIQKSFLLLFFVAIAFGLLSYSFIAEKNEYLIVDVSSGKIEEVESCNDFYTANYLFSYYLNQYDNLVLLHNDQVLKMEYGIVEFNNNDTCEIETSYRSTINNTTNSINSCFGADAAYLYSSYDGENVYFMISGDIGIASIEDVVLHPLELLNADITKYQNIDGELYHHIKTQLSVEYYAYSFVIDKSPSYLSKNRDYYSYDGHYFYDDFKLMIDDYNGGCFDNSINKDNPYYNYYEYLPFRTLTNYDISEIKSYFYNTLMIDGKIQNYIDMNGDGANDVVNKSQYFETLEPFYEYQNIYGANALLSLAISIEDSSWGKSYDSFINNFLFLKLAFDCDEERINERYESLEKSIYAFDKYYVNNKYSNYRTKKYSGTYLGNKASGLAMQYSLDPYWNEKVINNFYKIDKSLGNRDYNSYCLGIIDKTDIYIYNDDLLSEIKYVIKGIKDYSFVILEENENSYLIQLDTSETKESTYDFDNCVGFVNKECFDLILNKDKIHKNRMVEITFDANGGTVYNQPVSKIKSLYGTTPVMAFRKDGYRFESFDKELTKATEPVTYVAAYKKIDNLLLATPFESEVELGKFVDLKGAKLSIEYKDGSKELVDIDSEMIEGLPIDEEGKQTIKVNYCGLAIEENVVVVDKTKLVEKTKDDINNIIQQQKNKSTYNKEKLLEIKKRLGTIQYNLDFHEIRVLDELLLREYRNDVNYRIDDNIYDMSLSGMGLSLPFNSNTSFKPLNNTYYARITNVNSKDKERLSELASAYGFGIEDFIKISFFLNMQKIELEGPIVVSLNIENLKNNVVYSVYRLDENGDIVKCKTVKTKNGIEFITDSEGNFALLSKNSINDYYVNDKEETISTENSDPDNKVLFVSGWFILALIVIGTTSIVIYRKTEEKRRALWKDYKKLLQKVDFVQEEKPKN